MSGTGEVVIRRARPTDALLVLDLLEKVGGTASPAWARLRTEGGLRGGMCLVAVRGGELDELVGVAHVYRLPEPLSHDVCQARVSALVVDHQYRSRGIGSALLAACEQEARDMGAAFLEVATPHRRHRTRDFCPQRGYIQTRHSFSKDLTSEQ